MYYFYPLSHRVLQAFNWITVGFQEALLIGFMDRQLELLKFLHKKDAALKSVNITEKLKKLGFIDNQQTMRFLKKMHSDGYIDYEDKRPSWLDTMGGTVIDMSGEPNYEAKISTVGIRLIDEKRLKDNGNRYAKYSFAVAGLALILSIVQWYSSYRKDEKSKDDLRMLSIRLDSLVRTTNGKAKLPLPFSYKYLKKDSVISDTIQRSKD